MSGDSHRAEQRGPFAAIRELERSMQRQQREAQDEADVRRAKAREDAAAQQRAMTKRAHEEVENRRVEAIAQAKAAATRSLAEAQLRIVELEQRAHEHQHATVEALVELVIGGEA